MTSVLKQPQLKISRYHLYHRKDEASLYYYGARYLDPRISRWLSVDPAMYEGDYLPSAPTSDEARQRNQNLPGLGGIYNYVNFHVYHYAGNNPVMYIDPDGRFFRYINRHKSNYTFGEPIPDGKNQKIIININTLFGNIQTEINITDRGIVQYDFSNDNNNYFNILIRGGGETLARAIYDATTRYFPDLLEGRTIGGINLELQLHYYVYVALNRIGLTDILLFRRAKIADMGGIFGEDDDYGYDSNAILFQSLQAFKIIHIGLIFPNEIPWVSISTIEEVLDYLR